MPKRAVFCWGELLILADTACCTVWVYVCTCVMCDMRRCRCRSRARAQLAERGGRARPADGRAGRVELAGNRAAHALVGCCGRVCTYVRTRWSTVHTRVDSVESPPPPPPHRKVFFLFAPQLSWSQQLWDRSESSSSSLYCSEYGNVAVKTPYKFYKWTRAVNFSLNRKNIYFRYS